MPHTRPNSRTAGKLNDQQPSPPISRDDSLQEAQRHPRLQRQNWTSNNYNSIQSVARIFVDWVMEDEVPVGNHRFRRDQERGNRARVLKRGANDLRRVDDAGVDEVAVFFALRVVAEGGRLLLLLEVVTGQNDGAIALLVATHLLPLHHQYPRRSGTVRA